MSIYLMSLILGATGAFFIVVYGEKLDMKDIPNHRSSHAKVVPKGGGIGIVTAFIVASLYLGVPIGFWFSALVISVVGYWGGDKHKLSPRSRLVIQLLCGYIFLFSCKFEYSGIVLLLSVPSVVYIVGTTNFYNFMDGIDGISGITTVVGFSLISFYLHLLGDQGPYATLALGIVFSTIGFLYFNLPRARLFMGDLGSLLLGYLFACIIVLYSENITDFFIMAGFLFPFYLDELITMIIRLKKGMSLLEPHRLHLYQILANELKICHWKISIIYGLAQLFIGGAAIMLRSNLILLILFYVCCSLLFVLLYQKIVQKVAKNAY